MNQLLGNAGARRYCVITPCRNESRYARRTLESVARQTIPPALWVVVDDGSSDTTLDILRDFCNRLPYLKVVQRSDRGFRRLGGGVIDAFYHGLRHADLSEFEFLCKLDLDLDMPPNYFQSMMERMESNERIGTCSGKPYYRTSGGDLVREDCGDENSVGMIKFYRRACFEEIGGFVPAVMWDGIDGHRCRMHGWIAVSWDVPSLRFEHLRPMGSSVKGRWVGRKRHGAGQYFMGTNLAYIVASSLYRMTRRPRILGGMAILWGYLAAAAMRMPKYSDAEFVRFLRSFQWRALFTGKSRAVKHFNEKQEPKWENRRRDRPARGARSHLPQSATPNTPAGDLR